MVKYRYESSLVAMDFGNLLIDGGVGGFGVLL